MSLNYKINEQIKDHSINVDSWEHHIKAEFCYDWFSKFNSAFFENKLEQCLLSFERSRFTTLGHYILEYNQIGAIDNININSVHLYREKWEILETLLHEMVHQYQRRLGGFSDENKKKPTGGYHNREFLSKMEEFGLSANRKGQAIAIPKGRFAELLKENKIEITERSTLGGKPEKPRSKLKKYSCQCEPAINIRVAVSEFSATCNACNSEFELQE